MEMLPSGTVTFLLTDIENSSTHWEEAPVEMRVALAAHDEVVEEVVPSFGGSVFKHMGDGCWACFSTAPAAADAAIEIQRRIQGQPDEIRARLKIRIGIHTGNVDPTDGDYFGPVPNRSARIADLANGDQIVCSATTAGLLTQFDLHSDGLHELRGIGVQEVFIISADDVFTDPRSLRLPVVPSNLPRIHTTFVGRSDDVERTTKYLQNDHSVVTLIGPGGVGKTRLAIEVGHQFAPTEPVHFCNLAVVTEDDDVAASVANTVGARQQPGMDLLDSIADYLSERELLLILDNCEHVVGAVGKLVVKLEHASKLQVVATSRSALGIVGEQLVVIEPLPPETAGVELFVSRAQQKDASFELTDENEADVREITKRLDGIPLAIELAAARIQLMSPAELAAGLDDRFRLLSGHRPGRQETLRETVQWSHRLLSPQEAALFVRMSVFAGGADLDAITQVCTDHEEVTADAIPDLLLGLVDKSMVVSSLTSGRRRFTLLETMRRFGHEELEQTGSLESYRVRHAEYYANLAERENDRLFSAGEPDVWVVLNQEWANLRLAVDTLGIEGDLTGGAQLVVALVWYATFSMRFELFTWAEELLTIEAIETHPAYTDLCGAAALGAYLTVNGQVTSLAEAGLAKDPSDPQGFCRTALAAVFLNNVHTAEASGALTLDWLDAKPTTIGGRLWAEGFRVFHLCSHGPAERAPDHASTVVGIANETNSPSAKALAAWSQGMVVTFDDLDAAIQIWTDGLEWPRSRPREQLGEQLLDGLRRHFTVTRNDVTVALKNCRDAVQKALDQHYYAGTSHLFGVSAVALCRSGDAKTGARLVGAMIANGHLPRENAQRALQDALGDEVELYKQSGRTLSVTQAANVALDALDAALASTSTKPT